MAAADLHDDRLAPWQGQAGHGGPIMSRGKHQRHQQGVNSEHAIAWRTWPQPWQRTRGRRCDRHQACHHLPPMGGAWKRRVTCRCAQPIRVAEFIAVLGPAGSTPGRRLRGSKNHSRSAERSRLWNTGTPTDNRSVWVEDEAAHAASRSQTRVVMRSWFVGRGLGAVLD